jgi:outer membrane scaffolding protein for murein synthesis (MipA/OmpV family)
MHDLGTSSAAATVGDVRHPKTKLIGMACLPIFVVGAWSLTPAAVRAQELQEGVLEQQGLAEQPPTGDWNITLGAGFAVRPTYPGASAYHARPIPLVSITYRNLFFLGPGGLGVNAVNWSGFHAGPVLGFEGGRNQGDDPHLNGLGDIQPSVTAGLFAAYRFGPFEVLGTAAGHHPYGQWIHRSGAVELPRPNHPPSPGFSGRPRPRICRPPI